MKRLLGGMMIMTGWALTACVGLVGPAPQQPQALAVVKASLAQGYMAQGQWQEAFKQIDQAVALLPNDVSLWLIRAELYRQQARPTEAQQSYAQALRLAPSAGAPNHHYAWYLCQDRAAQAEPVEVMRYFERALADVDYAYLAQVRAQQHVCQND
ncbi:MAG: tetratricopeptide repeat protein [Neisseriaceae bacterium]|nr:tetratricopeptide repeat protein [Neisseriaceae bacterium]MBP6861564.1 tetratricopeptide repeat protein [Neisseriaceae bacterium]